MVATRRRARAFRPPVSRGGSSTVRHPGRLAALAAAIPRRWVTRPDVWSRRRSTLGSRRVVEAPTAVAREAAVRVSSPGRRRPSVEPTAASHAKEPSPLECSFARGAALRSARHDRRAAHIRPDRARGDPASRRSLPPKAQRCHVRCSYGAAPGRRCGSAVIRVGSGSVGRYG